MNILWNTVALVMMIGLDLQHIKNQRSSKTMKPVLRIAGRGLKRQRARLTPATKKGKYETDFC